MKQISLQSRFILIFTFLLMLNITVFSVKGDVSISSKWCENPPVINGNVDIDEWGNNPLYETDLFSLYVMNDETNLYFAFKIPDVYDNNDALYMYFDEGEGGGSYDKMLTYGDEDFKWSAAHGKFYKDGFFGDEHGNFIDDTDENGNVDGSSVWVYHKDHWEIEHIIPINNDEYDLNLDLLDTIGFAFAFWDEEDFIYTIKWPVEKYYINDWCKLSLTQHPSQEYDFIFIGEFTIDGQSLIFKEDTPALAVEAGDWNNDGLMDLFIGTYFPSHIYYYQATDNLLSLTEGVLLENEGTPWQHSMGATPRLNNIIGNSVMDLTVGSWHSLRYYNILEIKEYPFFDLKWEGEESMEDFSYVTHFFEDFNNDGLLDLVYADSKRYGIVKIRYNKGTSVLPVWGDPIDLINQPSYGKGIDICDYNSDGYSDIILRGHENIYLYLNEGSYELNFMPNGEISVENQNLLVNSRSFSLCDWDADGNLDLIAGGYAGKLYLFSSNIQTVKPSNPEPIPPQSEKECAITLVTPDHLSTLSNLVEFQAQVLDENQPVSNILVEFYYFTNDNMEPRIFGTGKTDINGYVSINWDLSDETLYYWYANVNTLEYIGVSERRIFSVHNEEDQVTDPEPVYNPEPISGGLVIPAKKYKEWSDQINDYLVVGGEISRTNVKNPVSLEYSNVIRDNNSPSSFSQYVENQYSNKIIRIVTWNKFGDHYSDQYLCPGEEKGVSTPELDFQSIELLYWIGDEYESPETSPPEISHIIISLKVVDQNNVPLDGVKIYWNGEYLGLTDILGIISKTTTYTSIKPLITFSKNSYITKTISLSLSSESRQEYLIQLTPSETDAGGSQDPDDGVTQEEDYDFSYDIERLPWYYDFTGENSVAIDEGQSYFKDIENPCRALIIKVKGKQKLGYIWPNKYKIDVYKDGEPFQTAFIEFSVRDNNQVEPHWEINLPIEQAYYQVKVTCVDIANIFGWGENNNEAEIEIVNSLFTVLSAEDSYGKYHQIANTLKGPSSSILLQCLEFIRDMICHDETLPSITLHYAGIAGELFLTKTDPNIQPLIGSFNLISKGFQLILDWDERDQEVKNLLLEEYKWKSTFIGSTYQDSNTYRDPVDISPYDTNARDHIDFLFDIAGYPISMYHPGNGVQYFISTEIGFLAHLSDQIATHLGEGNYDEACEYMVYYDEYVPHLEWIVESNSLIGENAYSGAFETAKGLLLYEFAWK